MYCNSNQQIFIMETIESKQSEFKHSEFKQSFFQAKVALDGKVISSVLVRDFLTACYYLSILRRVHANELRFYCVTTYSLTLQQFKEINSNPELLGYKYFSTFK